MAARLNPMHQEMVRDKIQASQLINALQNHVLKKRKMANSQIRAALGLLAKCVPDMQRTELTGDGGAPMEINIVRYSDRATQPVDPKGLPAAGVEGAGTGRAPRAPVLAPKVG